ncbi:hypothetical protein A2W57_00775 [Candidatus Giovannonibacteria bacterium RIFCSPHIGHO2_02_43_16]|uniref:DUF91 domain-containing protein n=1 Tax=Candidatus Giovannonibacteria bacterium RIFCSPHIGHO2_02_43_16 TaxID=1798331 RepID=A0A1F5WFB2_9BACT|nr:MAG: hypothetical protein A2W57_00775 [Candidatus Giovannonibacteria bacterium RIFCSPHIGHO2_02_43_16]
MAIIISKKGKNAQRIEKSNFEKEDYLQQYIYDNPESIPLYDIKEDIRLLILAREFPTNSGPIDAIGVDKDGEIYLIETKLYKNPDKRYVVAQVLDYGAALWSEGLDFDEFSRRLDEEVNKKLKIPLRERLKEFFELGDEEAVSLLENIRQNLNKGNFRFVVLMDKLHDQLKDLIIFINENSRFDIFAVELEYYKHEEYEILIPRIFGAEVKKDIAVSSSGKRQYREWDKESFFQDAQAKIQDKTALATLSELYKFSKENADSVEWGSGADKGTFTFKVIPWEGENKASVFTVWSDGAVSFRFGNIQRKIDQNVADALYEKLKGYAGMKSKEYMYSSKGFALRIPLQTAFPDQKAISRFKQAILEFKKEIKS